MIQKFVFGAKPKAPITAFVQLLQLGETLGFDAAWVPDQTFFPDPFVSIAMCGAATKQIELVIGVANPYTRHPVQVARAAATLDDALPGRVALGYGAGNRKELILPLGGEQIQAAAHCREAIVICRRLLQGEMLHHRGLFVADGVELEMAPHPDVPIYLAARGPRVLKVAGEVSDVAVVGALVSEAGIRFALKHIELGTQQAGRTLDDVDVMLWISCYISDDKMRWLDHYRPSAAHILAGAPTDVFEALALSKAFEKELKSVYAEKGSAGAAYLIPDDLIQQLAAIGDPLEVAEQLQQAAELGVNQIGILVNAPTVAESQELLRRFADEVIPRIR